MLLIIVLPMAFGVLLATGSAVCVFKTRSLRRRLPQWPVLAGVLVAAAYSELMLWNMAHGAWPTCLPHLLLVGAAGVVLGQAVAAAGDA